MKLAVTVPHPVHPEHDLLRAGYTLAGPVIERMRQLGITFLYVDYPPLADLDRALLPHLSPARKQVYGQIKRSIESVQAHARPQVSYNQYYALTRQFVTSVMQQGKQPIYLDELSTRMGNAAIVHATTVAHLCLMLGIELEAHIARQRKRPEHGRPSDLLNLGVAGMLHDLGKSTMPPRLQACHTLHLPTTDVDRAVWETHAELGYNLIRSEVEASAAAAVRQHHQHYDGSGFPHRRHDGDDGNFFAGDRIHVYARILFAADLYDRLSFREDGRRRYAFEVLHLIRLHHAAVIDPDLLSVLPKVIPPFPPGMTVELSDGSNAVVLDLNRAQPYRPTVQRFATDGWTLAGPRVDLAREPDLAIRSAVGVAVAGMVPDVRSRAA
jgi:HD-GYP domain-containing protein (c-di-GMP phosphodiesterase class II)